jgi:hypothetical protein
MLAVARVRGVAFAVPSFDPDESDMGIVTRCAIEPPLLSPDTVVAWDANPRGDQQGVISAVRAAAREVRAATEPGSKQGA